MSQHKLSLQLYARCDCVLILRAMVNTLCGRVQLSAIEKNRVGLAVDELYANIVRHGYQGEAKPLTFDADIELEADGGEVLVFSFHDVAPVVDISGWNNEGIQACSATDMMPGGLGIPLIHAIMDEVKHEVWQDGNHWILRYRPKNKRKGSCDEA